MSVERNEFYVVLVDYGADDMEPGEEAAVALVSIDARDDDEALDIAADNYPADEMLCYDEYEDAYKSAEEIAEEYNTNVREY